ncbi:MAG: methyltransferase domain-containing protein [Candidatus Omnitrophica bacterium]|nr:methyltransferase domain-containing protein [Candidatus Omnitrophota bacterium]
MVRSLLYKALENPVVFNVSQAVLAPGTDYFLKQHYRKVFRDSGGLVLDVGCGPKPFTPNPDQGIMVGVDMSVPYAREYAQHRARRGVAAMSERLPFKDNIFDETRCFGLLHHLNEQQAIVSLRELVRCTRPGGRIIVFDSVWPDVAILRPLPWLSHRFDRGRWMLTEKELVKLLNKAYPDKWTYYRFTYTFYGHEALILTAVKEP